MNSLKLILTRRHYFGPALVFATLNVLFGTWAIYIPTIKTKLGIDEGDLGFAIFFMALGTLVLITLAPKIIKYIGVGKATAFGIFIFLFSFIIPFSADQYVWFCAGLFIVGAFSGFTDVAMNALVTEIEKKDNVHIMSANHGFFSLGGFLSAGIGGFLLPLKIVPLNHLLFVIGILLVLNIIFVSSYYKISTVILSDNGFRLKNLRPLVVIGAIAFFIMASEGAIVDWSALYMEKVSLAKLSLLGLGYTVFSVTMAIGRFFGDSISHKFGSKLLILVGLFIAAIGFGSILLVNPIVVIIGFGMVGLGLSVVIPELFRIGGKVNGIEPSLGISFISGIGFMGFLVGPVLLGFLAHISSLKLSFLALFGFIIVSILLALNIKRRSL